MYDFVQFNDDAFQASAAGGSACGKGWIGVKGACRRAKGKGKASKRLTPQQRARAMALAEKVRESRGMKPRSEVNAEKRAAQEWMQENKGKGKGKLKAIKGGASKRGKRSGMGKAAMELMNATADTDRALEKLKDTAKKKNKGPSTVGRKTGVEKRSLRRLAKGGRGLSNERFARLSELRRKRSLAATDISENLTNTDRPAKKGTVSDWAAARKASESMTPAEERKMTGVGSKRKSKSRKKRGSSSVSELKDMLG
jgi:hypothetical protein